MLHHKCTSSALRLWLTIHRCGIGTRQAALRWKLQHRIQYWWSWRFGYLQLARARTHRSLHVMSSSFANWTREAPIQQRSGQQQQLALAEWAEGAKQRVLQAFAVFRMDSQSMAIAEAFWLIYIQSSIMRNWRCMCFEHSRRRQLRVSAIDQWVHWNLAGALGQWQEFYDDGHRSLRLQDKAAMYWDRQKLSSGWQTWQRVSFACIATADNIAACTTTADSVASQLTVWLALLQLIVWHHS